MSRKMKDSDVEWIGEIPENFMMIKTKYLCNVRNGLTYSPTDLCNEDEGVLVLRSSNIKDGALIFEDNVYVNCEIKSELMVNRGDILLCSRNGSKKLIGKNAIIENDLKASFGAFMMIVRGMENPKYMYYILNSNIFSYYLGTFLTATINQLTSANFSNMIIPYCKDKKIQNRIVAYLDAKCSQIDTLISNQQKQIEKLKQYKQSLITEVVTKGLNPDAEMKDSGVEWIGEIPNSFIMIKTKYLCNVRNGLTYSPTDLCNEDKGVLVLRSSNIKDGTLIFDDNVYVNCEIKSELMVNRGDILLCSRNGSKKLIGKNAIIENDLKASFGAFMMIVRGMENPKYMYYILNSNNFSYYLGTFLTATINQLTGANFSNMVIPYCEDEKIQQKIVDFLDEKCNKIDSLISIKQQKIEKLNEYKKSIIYEYVTGKKEV